MDSPEQALNEVANIIWQMAGGFALIVVVIVIAMYILKKYK